MSQVITNAFEQYWQSSLAAEQPVVLDEFILADIPNLDITAPIDPDTVLPPESQIVHRQSVDQRGRINNNAVAYTIVMDTTVGDFSFNAMYLRNKQNGVIGMIVYKGRETKLKTDQTTGQTGNSLVKSMLMGYDQAAEATLTNVDAGTWQIDYAARLRGMDEDIRQLQADLYGHHTFVGDGFKVVETDGAFQVTPGVAIVGGLRVELKQPEVIYPGTTPIGVWVDVHRSGSLLSEHQNHFTIITSVADLTDHVDGNGYQHFVAKLGTVQADSTVIDGRGQGGSGVSGAIPDTFSLWRRSMAEAGYELIGQFGTEMTIETAAQVVLSKDGKNVYAWKGDLPKKIKEQNAPEEDSSWRSIVESTLRKDISSGIGSSMVGDDIDGTVKEALEKLRDVANENSGDIEFLKGASFPHMVEGYDIFYIYGQSNAVGYADNTGGYPNVDEAARYWNYQSKKIEKIPSNMKFSSGDVSTGHAWAAFSNEYTRRTGRGVIIVPCAKGGTAIGGLIKGSPTYQKMLDSALDLEGYITSNGIKVLSRSLCFHQGETDMSDGTGHNEYISSLDILLRDIRADLSVNKTFIWRVGCPQNRKEGSWYGIQSAQDYICQSYDWAVMAFSGCGTFTIGNGLLREGVHYTQKGYNLMGAHGARIVAESLLEDSPASQDEIRMYGGLLTTPDQIWRYTYARALYQPEKTFKILDISETGYSYRASNIKSIENMSDRLRFHIQSRANYLMGFDASVNTTGGRYGLSVKTQAVSLGNNEWVIDVYFYKDLEFMVSLDTGNIANPDGTTENLYPWIGPLVSSEKLLGKHYLVRHPVAQGFPTVVAFHSEDLSEDNVKPIFLTGVSSSFFKVKTHSATGAKALIGLKNVSIPIACLPDSIQVDIKAVVAAKKL
ncbi:phage tail protein [Aeromonas media]|uniref:phage tail-collar fiber domain-containing protein n=1 Tax=Aeromonas media TaxID=651 RepID=UPI0038D1ABAF